MKKLLIACGLLFLFGLAGCHYVNVDYYAKQYYPPTTNIDIYQTNKPDKPYIEIAKIETNGNLEKLKNKARELGADAIIMLEETTERAAGSFGSVVSGVYMPPSKEKKRQAVAIKYTTESDSTKK